MGGYCINFNSLGKFTGGTYGIIADFITNNAFDELSVVCHDFRILLNKENIASPNESFIILIDTIDGNKKKICAIAILEYKNDSYEILCLIIDTKSDVNNKRKFLRTLMHELYSLSDKIIYKSDKIKELETNFRKESILRVKKSIPNENEFFVMSSYID